MFKGVIDTATAFLNIVTQILDKLPLLSTAIGGFAGFKLSQAGLGKQLNINHTNDSILHGDCQIYCRAADHNVEL